jgi:hypothetical protein
MAREVPPTEYKGLLRVWGRAKQVLSISETHDQLVIKVVDERSKAG